jgi:hypothetical protein
MFAFGDAAFLGSTGKHLGPERRPVVGRELPVRVRRFDELLDLRVDRRDHPHRVPLGEETAARRPVAGGGQIEQHRPPSPGTAGGTPAIAQLLVEILVRPDRSRPGSLRYTRPPVASNRIRLIPLMKLPTSRFGSCTGSAGTCRQSSRSTGLSPGR